FRYRKTYGFSRFVTQERFDELVRGKLLEPLLNRKSKTDPQIYRVLR
ncbi:MAG: hypothetical protein IID45_10405, partial [Planctomycetes bacterium]|nr:hypothetical protein [Planctomycetota bacterium]